MPDNPDLERMARQLSSIGKIEKCRGCSCFVDTVREYRELLERKGVADDSPLARTAEDLLARHPVEHGCLGCDPCYPVAVSNRIFRESAAAPGSGVDLPLLGAPRPEHVLAGPAGWPVVPGDYVVGNVRAPVAVSTLASPDLVPALVREVGLHRIAIVGKTETENLGVEKVVRNVVANPSIRVLVLCGDDAAGHRPAATLLALVRNGTDDQGRVVGSPGRRPVLRNASAAEVSRFREQVEVVDLVGEKDPRAIGERVAAESAAARHPLGPWTSAAPMAVEDAPSPPPWVPDPKGYFVILLDAVEGVILVECYAYDGRLLGTLRGASAKVLYHALIARGWLSRLDHAAYLGRELTRAEQALDDGAPYVQDGA